MTRSALSVLTATVSGCTRAELTGLLAAYRDLTAEEKADPAAKTTRVAIITALLGVIRREDVTLPTSVLVASIRDTYEAHNWTLPRESAERVTVDAHMRIIEDRHELTDYIDRLAEEGAQRARSGELNGETATESNRRFVAAILEAATSA